MSRVRKSTPSFSSRPLVSPQLADSIRKWLANWNIRSSGEQAPPKTDGTSITVDAGNRLKLVGFPAAGISSGPLLFANSANTTPPPGALAGFGSDAAGDVIVNAGSGQSFSIRTNGVQQSAFGSNGNLNVYRGRNTAGFAFLVDFSDPATSIGLIAASTNFINFTPPSTAGKYMVFWSVDCTVATTDNFHVQITFKDASGNAINQTCGGFDKAGSALVAGAITNTIGTGVYYGFMIFSIDNSATAITLSTAGTFTTVTYNLDATLYQLA